MRLNFVCRDSKDQCLNISNGVLSRVAIGHGSRKIGKLGDPATVFFTLDFNF